MEKEKLPNEITGNIGLYYACYELSKRGWNVLPTSRNTRGIDIIIYNIKADKKISIQIKTLSKRNPVPLGSRKKNMIAEIYMIIRISNFPQVFIMTKDEIIKNITEREKNGKKSYWLQPKYYEQFENKWEKIVN